ncbi:MAG: hypothetical protein JOZ78_02720 [Chroococcidiopsidaceae cyanobacterium CP_BM_ER_R8_30]|nr:hypothetical protein [Chroococcidiopsidaceae cyanobacterium CP_BM_ER_R8_30]
MLLLENMETQPILDVHHSITTFLKAPVQVMVGTFSQDAVQRKEQA